jgi:chromosome segregation ATPase
MEALEMERPMTEWNDDRLEELNERVKDGFAEVDTRFDKVDERFVRLEGEMKAGFKHADERLNAAFDHINVRIDRIYYAIVLAAVGVIGALLANGVGG